MIRSCGADVRSVNLEPSCGIRDAIKGELTAVTMTLVEDVTAPAGIWISAMFGRDNVPPDELTLPDDCAIVVSGGTVTSTMTVVDTRFRSPLKAADTLRIIGPV